MQVVSTIEGGFTEQPITYDGHDVWLVRENAAVSGGGSLVERRDADSGRLLGTVAVHQVLVHSIAGDGPDRSGSRAAAVIRESRRP